ncbi:hypothetical protein ES703_21564 [subsurface metagenome]
MCIDGSIAQIMGLSSLGFCPGPGGVPFGGVLPPALVMELVSRYWEMRS